MAMTGEDGSAVQQEQSVQPQISAELPPPIPPQQRNAAVERLFTGLIRGELLTRTTLAADAKLSGSALSSVIEDLRWRGVLLTPEATEPGLRGPKTRYKLNASRGYVLAIGFGHDRLGVAVTDLAGRIVGDRDYVDEDVRHGAVDEDPTGSLERAARQARSFLDGLGEPAENLVGVGVSLPAPLMKRYDHDDGAHLYAGFMDEWQPRDIVGELRRLLNLPEKCAVVVENDANLEALREHRRGAARGFSHACVVKWGAGLGAGLIVGDQIYRGPRGLAGEIGHVTVAPWLGDNKEETAPLFEYVTEEERTCARCKQTCLEALISASGLVRHLQKKAAKEHRRSRITDIKAIIAAAHAGDDECRDVLMQAAHLLGHKLGPIVSAFNLQRVIVDCFADASAFNFIVDGLKDGLEHRMTPAAYEQVKVVVATAEEKGSVLGAADLVLERHLGNWIGRLPLSPPDVPAHSGASANGASAR